MPAEVGEAWARLQERLTEAVNELEAAVGRSALVPLPVVEGLRRGLRHKLARTERRLLAAAKRRDDRIRRDIITVTANLYPLGKRQERTLNFIPMLARNGEDLLAAMLAEARGHAAALVPAGAAETRAAR
jgi:uncharacterized protein YllA (UPF0747 family)